jgi:heavy metal translocating P-type ATPase
MILSYNSWRLWYTLITLLLFIASFFLPTFFIYVPLLLAFLPISFAAFEQIQAKHLGTEVFLVIATVLALIGHGEQAITIVLLIMLFAEYLQDVIESRTESALESLLKLIPETALVKSGIHERLVPVTEIAPGMLIVVKTGNRIPVDGSVKEGSASVNESSLTGESILKEKTQGHEVFAGTYVESGSIIIKAEKVGKNTFFGRIRSLMEQAEKQKASIAQLADRIALIFIPVILFLIVIVWLLTGNIRLIITLLVFGSPLELTLITPLAIIAGSIAAFKEGILVKGGYALERYAHIDTIIFDKTGTLTLGEPEVIDIHSYNKNYSKQDILKIAAIAEKRSGHVLAKAVLKKAAQEGIEVPDPESYNSLAGHGIQITYQGVIYFLGSKHFIEALEHCNIPVEQGAILGTHHTTFYLGCPGTLCGTVSVADIIRPDAKATVEYFKQSDIQVMLLSGDRQEVTTHIAQTLAIDAAYGEIMPDKKLEIIRKLQANKHAVAMVGDGINDAPALKQASVGIALGAMGMEPAINAADIVLMTNHLYKITFMHRLSKKVIRIIKQNIFIGFMVVHTFGIILAFLTNLGPVQAALFHALPDLLILINSARLINFKSHS